MQTTKVQLGRGGKVHAANVYEGYQSSPMCGGNRATEGYREVSGEVDCKNCLSILAKREAKSAAKVETTTPEPRQNVVSVNGGKVHTMMTGSEEHPYPLCRGGGMNQNLTKFRATDAPLSCQTCMTYAERREAKRIAEGASDQHETAYDALFYAEDGNTLAEGICERCKDSAEENADDTSAEEGFEHRSERWYEVAVNTYSSAHGDHMAEDERAAYFRETDRERLGDGPRKAYDAAFAEAKGKGWSAADAHESAMDAARAIEDAEAHEYNAAFERGRALGKDYAEAHEYADEVIRNARIRAEQKGEEMPATIQGPVYALVGKELHAAFNGEKTALCGKGETRPVPRSMANSVNTAPMCTNCATISDAWHENQAATTEKGDEMPPRKRAAAKTTEETVADAVSNLTEEQRDKVREVVNGETAPEAAPTNDLASEYSPIEGDTPTDTADAIQRVKDITAQVLAVAEVGESADPDRIKELADSAEAIIQELPTEHRTALRAALAEAKRGESYTGPGRAREGKKAEPKKKTASKAVAKKAAAAAAKPSKETQDYKAAIPEAEKVVADISASLAAGVKHEIDNATSTRAVAEKILHARLHLTDKDGHPDFHGKSHAAKSITTDVITGAGKGIERNEESEDALDRLMKSVQNLRNDVLVKYVRHITLEDAVKFFPLAVNTEEAKKNPAAAIRKFYNIPEKSTFEIQAEKRRLERAQRKALAAGDEKKAKELTEAIKTVGKTEGEGEGEGETAAAPSTPAEKRKAKHVGAIEAATEKLGSIESDLDKIAGPEAADLAAQLEALIGKTSTLVAMLKQK